MLSGRRAGSWVGGPKGWTTSSAHAAYSVGAAVLTRQMSVRPVTLSLQLNRGVNGFDCGCRDGRSGPRMLVIS